jgi:hypothetical protein
LRRDLRLCFADARLCDFEFVHRHQIATGFSRDNRLCLDSN